MNGFELSRVAGEFAVWKLPPGADPKLAGGGQFLSVTRTPDEVSVVSLAKDVPEGAEVEAGWGCLRVAGPLSFELTGVLAALSAPLAAAGVPIFVVSTFDTDYLLVPLNRLEKARDALEAAGHAAEF